MTVLCRTLHVRCVHVDQPVHGASAALGWRFATGMAARHGRLSSTTAVGSTRPMSTTPRARRGDPAEASSPPGSRRSGSGCSPRSTPARPPRTKRGATSTAAWLRQHGTAAGAANREVTLATALVKSITATREALAGGRISPEQAAVITGAVDRLSEAVPDAEKAATEALLLDKASYLDPVNLRKAGVWRAAQIDPARLRRPGQGGEGDGRRPGADHLGRPGRPAPPTRGRWTPKARRTS